MERPLAVIVRRPGADVTDDELRAHLRGKFARWWMPDAFVYIDQIPRTATGKFQKLKLREVYSDWQRIENVIGPATSDEEAAT